LLWPPEFGRVHRFVKMIEYGMDDLFDFDLGMMDDID